MNYGFELVSVTNAPESFSSVQNGETKGYLIKLSQLKERPTFGTDIISDGSVTFGQDNVLIYDNNGIVYYAKGFENNGKIYYNSKVYVSK